ncbi:MAG: molybdate ABC transporter substrate-binding protein [Armatimonadetes bacterium]|nr:molybdate ABC transporter substrate-binding protein [Armatimonadota bacterium]
MRFRRFLTVLLLFALCAGENPSQGSTLLVSAASSLTETLPEIVRSYEKSHPRVRVQMNFGSSGSLQRQIERGALVDVFLSASRTQMDALQKKRLILSSTRTDFADNEIVLVAQKDSTEIRKWTDLHRAGISYVAISDPDTVPSGEYARQTLRKLGLWVDLQPRLVLGENVRQTLAYVQQKSVDAGVVFASDLRIARGLRLIARAPSRTHAPIVYTAAVTKSSRQPEQATAFARFLKSASAQATLKRFGFKPVALR